MRESERERKREKERERERERKKDRERGGEREILGICKPKTIWTHNIYLDSDLVS